MSKQDYRYAQSRYKAQETKLSALLDELSAQEQPTEEPHAAAKLTREMTLELVEQVIVHSKSAITVKFRFEDEYSRLQEGLRFPTGVAVNE